jgi:TP901 family phage tail tape measure protein
VEREAMISEMLLPSLGFTPLVMIACAVAMVVLRAGASRVFFDIVGTYQASKMIKDAESAATVLEALHMDAITGIHEAATELTDMFGELADSVIPISREIEEARIQFDKFLTVAEQTKETFDEIAEVGLAFGFAANEAYDAAARMAQLSGVLGGGTTAVGTEIGMIFGLISGMETEEGMQRLINLQQQTKFMTEGIEENATAEERRQMIYRNSMRVLDELNTIENRSAATMQQITYVMNQFASQAELTGESIAAMAAMSATLIEAGEEQGKGGRALRMIYARLGANTNGAADAIQNLGIQLYDAEGNMRPFSQILEEVARRYETMNGAEQQALAQSIAGNRHYTRLIKLLENVDRVKQLELEAHEAMFPAMDEANRRRETELFLLEQSEARLKNYQSALGDELLPALRNVTDAQTNFTNTLLQLVETPVLGGFIKGVAGMAMSFRSFLGPAFNVIISLQNMRIAMETNKAIMRSLNDVVLAGEHAYKNNMGVVVQNTMQLRLYNSILRDVTKQEQLMELALQQKTKGYHLHAVVDEKSLQRERQRLTTNYETIHSLREYKNSLTTMNERKRKAILDGRKYRDVLHELRKEIERLEAVAKRRAHRIATYETKVFKESAAAEQQKIRNLQEVSRRYNSASYAASLFGMALMGVFKNEKAQRAGMFLNIYAMSLQIAKQFASYKVKVKDTGETISNTIAQKINTAARRTQLQAINFSTVSVISETQAVNLSTAAAARNTQAKVAASAASLSLAASVKAAATAIYSSLGPLGWLALGVSALAFAFSDAKTEVDDFNVSLADFSKATELAQKHTSDELKAMIADQDQIIRDLEGATDANALADLEAAKSLKATLESAISKQMAGRGDLLDVYRFLQDEEQKIEDKYSRTGGGAKIIQMNREEDAINALKEEYKDFYDFFEANSIESEAELERFMIRHNNSVVDSTALAIGGMTEVVNAGADAIYNFANAREELFYGFSASNVTGDLIRQVNQQGVETLITTTEVIMTNNFNGMTVPEVADQIIDEIESRGNLKGFNFATAG